MTAELPLFEGNPVGEGTTRRGTATPVHRPQLLDCELLQEALSGFWWLPLPPLSGLPALNRCSVCGESVLRGVLGAAVLSCLAALQVQIPEELLFPVAVTPGPPETCGNGEQMISHPSAAQVAALGGSRLVPRSAGTHSPSFHNYM